MIHSWVEADVGGFETRVLGVAEFLVLKELLRENSVARRVFFVAKIHYRGNLCYLF
jgi:hypothetical protein